MELFRDSIAPIATPIRPVYGGHDGHVELEAQGGNRDKYEYVEGVSCIQNYQGVLGPVYYSFDWGGRHFVAFSKEDSYFTQADIARKDRWLIEDLSAQPDGRETVLFMHTPPAVEFLDLLGRYNVKLVLFGHTHCSKAFRYNGMTVGGPTPLCFGGYDGNSRGYRLVRFTDDGFEFDLVQQTTKARRSARPKRVFVGGHGETLDLLWSHALPGPTHRAVPVRHGDNLLYSVTDDNLRGNAGVYSIDSSTGRREWHLPTDTSVKNAVAVDEDGLAVATSVAGRVHGIDANSGELTWSRDLPRFPGRWIYTSPIITEGTVYTGGKAGYGAYDVATGEERWYTTLTTPVGSGDPVGDGWGSFPSPLVVGGLLITHLSGRGIIALDRANGEIVWETPLGITHYFSSPVMADGLIVSGVEFGQLAALDPETGSTVWQGEVLDAQYPTQMLVDGERMYVTTNQGRIRCLGLTASRGFLERSGGERSTRHEPLPAWRAVHVGGPGEVSRSASRQRDRRAATNGGSRDRSRRFPNRVSLADHRRSGRGRRPTHRSDVGRAAVGVRDGSRLRLRGPLPSHSPLADSYAPILSSCWSVRPMSSRPFKSLYLAKPSISNPSLTSSSSSQTRWFLKVDVEAVAGVGLRLLHNSGGRSSRGK